MNEIMKQYGGAIVVVASAVLLFTIIFKVWPVEQPDGSFRNGSFLTSVGQQVDKSMSSRVVDWGSHVDGSALNVHADRDKPTAKAKKHAVEKVTISLSDLFLLKDCDGREWRSTDKKWAGMDVVSGTVDVLSVKSSAGVEISDQTFNGKIVWDRVTQEFTFPEPDTLFVTLRIMDYDNVEATYRIPVAVDMEYPSP